MNFQEVLVILLFAAAMVYIGRLIYSNFTPKSGCGSNCKCGVDFSDIDIPKPKE